jgi:DNA-binding CsgD family transcriptional regulator
MTSDGRGLAGDLEYQISLAPSDWGRVLAAKSAQVSVGQRCWETMCGRDARCDGCPVGSGPYRPGEHRTSFIACETGVFLVRVAVVSTLTARVSVHRMTGADFESLVHARVVALSELHRLSQREHEVLSLLARGRAREQIAEAMSITERTVKFHQSNVLRKIGVSSVRGLLGALFDVPTSA